MRRILIALVGLLLAACGSTAQPAAGPTITAAPPPPTPSAQAVPANTIQIRLEEVGAGFERPLAITHAGDGSGRIFVAEQAGRIRLLDGALFLDISDRVGAEANEQGLLGLAFHPRFKENGYFYVNYTDRNGDTVIARFSSGDPLASGSPGGDPASEVKLLAQEQPAANHNGGMLAFGPDGMLYIGLGDGGGANDTYQNGQNLGALLGKILRIDVDSAEPYAIPADNPFRDNSAARPEIWAYGLRNPWRFSFDRANGDLYIGDVGQNESEWIHYQPAGAGGGQNYGWPIVEGTRCLRGGSCDRSGLTPPITEYSHDLGCTVAGGYVYRGQRYPALSGTYIFGDYCSGRIWLLQRGAQGGWSATEALETGANISSFGEDEAGEIYLSDLGGGTIQRLAVAGR